MVKNEVSTFHRDYHEEGTNKLDTAFSSNADVNGSEFVMKRT